MHGGNASGSTVSGYSSSLIVGLWAVKVFLTLSTMDLISGGSVVTLVLSLASMCFRISSWRRRDVSCLARGTLPWLSWRFMSFHWGSWKVVVF